jgi:hypothetical protein
VTPYPPAIWTEAIWLARTRGNLNAQIARELGMTCETPRLWPKQADFDDVQRSDGQTSGDQEELRQVRRENRSLLWGGATEGDSTRHVDTRASGDSQA